MKPDPKLKTIVTDAIMAGALEWVNGIRVDRGLDPLQTLHRGDHTYFGCPIAQSLGGTDSVASWGWIDRKVGARSAQRVAWHRVPPSVSQFCRLFDSGKAFGELVA